MKLKPPTRHKNRWLLAILWLLAFGLAALVVFLMILKGPAVTW